MHIVPPSFSKAMVKKNGDRSPTNLLSVLKINTELRIVESEDPVESLSSISSEYDLLILGSPEKDGWINLLLGGGKDKFTENSACSVLRLTMKN